ncbi:MAG: hypothetical protein ACD_9C00155G0003 [uncultured bacterium]|nr:MAG: hypothetical protein ACD_9C00155G0003 [uncultured bacterium]KKQ45574.1 MAG: Tetratricopeptide TPR_2 repeat protein [Candidatus Moranbacteria bacterium GW2011_GWC2_37_8]KKQ62277.1 MAG: Tetratricopeptide TPR_2 repeat protein [Parcubacteria group bacterium GW2011_GWC1_38_22]KKQ81151.1 MAG: Tetratricopeptide TPR_2 repeat protein [Candidatus Moranbacteria bacterium GW2011_GWD2_38_7]
MHKYSIRFWLIFWTVAAVFLSSWFLFWNVKNNGVGTTVAKIISILPIKQQNKNEYKALVLIGDYFFRKDDKEKKLLFLFQNNMEIRPGGGFIGAFGVVKMKNGKVQIIQTHDLSNFDARIPAGIEPPYPMKEIGYVENWKLRDSNFSPDFKINAEKAKEFYALAGGNAQFDGVIGITSNVLTSILKITGPIKLADYPGTYDSGNAILALEYQVEKAFEEQGIERDDRKSIMADLAEEIENKIFEFSAFKKIQLAQTLLQDLSQKDIQLNFSDTDIQQLANEADWSGKIDQDWKKDYLMTSDANLGAFKSDYYIKRSMDYSVDLSQDVPIAKLKITYNHTATQKDWMTRNYLTYLRVYVPEGSELIDATNFENSKIGSELNKKYFGSIIRVPIATSKIVEIDYTLPESMKDNYALKIQKQAGINDEPVAVHIVNVSGQIKNYSLNLDSDEIIE